MIGLLSILALSSTSAPLHVGKVHPKLSPLPVEYIEKPGTFVFNSEIQTVVTPSSVEDAFALSLLVNEVKEDLGISLSSNRTGKHRRIILKRTNNPKPTERSLQGYRLTVSPNEIVVSAESSDGIFNGVQTLRQLVRANHRGKSIPACTVVDEPVLTRRGWQHDISRGPIPSMDYLKKEIRLLSEFKLNFFTLYTEHVFRLKKHPEIAPKDGISAEQMTELARYGKLYHVEVAGNFQSFGHFANILSVPKYAPLGENPSVISPAKEESYRFLRDVYSEIAPAYPSPLFVINCDEVSGLGEGPSKDLVAKLGVAGVYASHINRIAELLKPFGKTPMMWGDIALNYPAIVPRLPKNLIVLPWAYDARPSFDNQIQPFTKFGLRFMVSPGVSCWSQIWPDTQNATVNINNFIRDGAKLGAFGSLNTSWDDDGQNLSNDNWYEFAWGGECSWRPDVVKPGQDPDKSRNAKIAQFDQAFPSLFYGLPDSELSRAINELSDLRRDPISGGLGNGAIFRDPVETYSAIGNHENLLAFRARVSSILEVIHNAQRRAKRSNDALQYQEFAAQEVMYLADSLLAIEQLKNGLARQAVELESRVKELKEQYIRLWNGENRPWWLDRNTAKFDALISRIHDIPTRVVFSVGEMSREKMTVKVRPLSPGARLFVTTDGSQPTEASAECDGNVTLTHSGTVRAIGIWPDGKRSPVESQEFYLPSLPSSIKTNMPTHADNIPLKAFDGSDRTYFWSEGSVSKGDFFEIDLEHSAEIGSIKLLTGTADHPSDFLHQGAIEVSTDGVAFERVASVTGPTASATFNSKSVRAVRIVVTGNQSHWLVIREIQIR